MKGIGAELAYYFGTREMRQNVGALVKYLVFLAVVIATFSVLFHFIMLYVEGQRHSWISGLYWTLTTMSTLGFGDITFQTDLGRAFSITVLLSGLVLILIVLPFVFIRFFYAPWLEARIQLRAPRAAREDVSGHVVVAAHDSIAAGLIDRLRVYGIPYYVIEPDPAVAAQMHADGVAVVMGDVDGRETYERLRVDSARLVFANREDTVNTNIALTVREVAPSVPIAAVVESQDSIDVAELAGCTHVLPLKQQLGEQLANRVNAGLAHAHVIGSFRDLRIAEFPVHNTPFAGRTIRETRLRELTGLNIVGVWERGRMVAPLPGLRLSDHSMPVVVGTDEQIAALDEFLVIYDANYNPVLVLGGGKVGRAATGALKRRGVKVHVIERNPELEPRIVGLPDRLFIGDAADRELLLRAGLAEAPSVILSTNDDAMNVFLAVYCRRLNPDLRIVSRITHHRNLEAICRAGADFVLSYASLGVQSVLALLQDREIVVLGEGADIYTVPLPESIADRTLAESGIGARTGLNVIAIRRDGQLVTNPHASTALEEGTELVMIGDAAQLRTFSETFV